MIEVFNQPASLPEHQNMSGSFFIVRCYNGPYAELTDAPEFLRARPAPVRGRIRRPRFQHWAKS